MRTRWQERLPDGGTRREQVLASLRDGPLTADGEPRDLRGISLIGEDLREVDLSGCNLTGADLSETDLSRSVLARCDLSGATLFKAVLDGSELMGAKLCGAKMQECSAVRAGFGHADLSGADLFQANLQGATLTGGVLLGADLRAANLEEARIRETDLREVDFTRARLRGADLCKSRVAGADFHNADLRESRLRALEGFDKATWVGADIRDVDFTGAYLLRRFMMDENYLFEMRNQGWQSRFVYSLWAITSDCGRSPVRWFAWNFVVALVFGGLYTLVNLDYGDHRTVLSPYYYSFVTLTTLGYGDVVPASATAQVLATFEVLLGYVGLGGLLSILANKMARRAD
jgi:uncharacterized protein YjbI with pentapeptide repeats